MLETLAEPSATALDASDPRPIGVFDSGVGGLTVVSALRRLLPGESILYLGDTARLPYGIKSPQTVLRYTRRNVDFLQRRGVKAVVVACNTASALALDELDEPLPVWGVVEPGAAAAVEVTRGRIGVVATEATILSDAYGRGIRRRNPGIEVLNQACPLFVPLVEEGWGDDPIARQIAERYLAPLLDAKIDTLVLGCTHYPVLKPVLREIVGDAVTLVDSAEAMAREVARELMARGIASRGGEEASLHLCVTDSSARFGRIARELLAGGGPPGDPHCADSASLELVEV